LEIAEALRPWVNAIKPRCGVQAVPGHRKT